MARLAERVIPASYRRFPTRGPEPVRDALGVRSPRLIARSTRTDGYLVGSDIETKGVRLIGPKGQGRGLFRQGLISARFVALAGLLMLGPASGEEAQPPVRQVLLLQSLDRGNMIVDFISSAYADRRKPDLIVSLAGPAAVFARKYRGQLFPESPLLFVPVDQRYLGDAPLGANETAVAVVNDFPGLVDDILQLLPETQQVFMVMGSGQIGQFWHLQLNEQFKRFHDRLTFVWSDDLSLPEILRRCASLPAHSAIFYFTFGTDAEGAAYADERVLAGLHATANAPLFAAHSVYLGSGIVGGTLMSIDDLARHTADVAVRLLNGASPSSVRVPPQPPGQPIFDWRELQRWGISGCCSSAAPVSGPRSTARGTWRSPLTSVAARRCRRSLTRLHMSSVNHSVR
jgi:hypothetical protein